MAQGNKSRIIIWTIVGILVVAAVIFLIIARKGAQTALPFTTEQVPKYVERTTKRFDDMAQEMTELRGQFANEAPDVFQKFDEAMEKGRAALQEIQTLTDPAALASKKAEIEDYRNTMRGLIKQLKKR
ncbi:MAG: hypothetical protein ABIL25_07435 [candidate division WOR-3 bacterium]